MFLTAASPPIRNSHEVGMKFLNMPDCLSKEHCHDSAMRGMGGAAAVCCALTQRYATPCDFRYILVRMKSAAETGYCFNVRRLRLQEKLVLLRYDPIDLTVQELNGKNLGPPQSAAFSEVVAVVPKFHYLITATTECVTKLEYFFKRNF
ncbi:hypothetical protein CIB84_000593 [Bambusicola thoracicus]|uniref:39S ribosomal protein L33, mitochondrial n=1 Tax=Bambusicola thoracicus TaxID=9083 RepID=A0A2P4TH22_BAMTH|nr:hypothetical protein CIB84_000593 [Bambusicola thoracicus]